MTRTVSVAVVILVSGLTLSSVTHGDSSESKRTNQQMRADVDAALKYLAAAEQAVADKDYDTAQRALEKVRAKLETLRRGELPDEKKVAYFTEKTQTTIKGHIGRVSVKVVDPTGVTRPLQLVIFPDGVPGEGWVQRSSIRPKKGVTTRTLHYGERGSLKENFRLVLFDVSRHRATLPIGHINEDELNDMDVSAVAEIMIHRTK